MAVSISLAITQNEQNIANNTSNVTVKVTAKWTYGSWNATGECTGSITIDGTKYSFSGITFNTGSTTSGSQVIMTKTVDVKHNDNGTKTVNCSASFVTGVSSGTVSTSGSKTLTTIPRKSSLSASNGTLGTAQTLTVTKQASAFTHTITYKCGSETGTVCTKSSSTSVSWTPPASLASQNKTGTSVSVTFTITTYSGNTDVGSNTKTINCTIPKKSPYLPTCTVAISESTNYTALVGGPVKGFSKFKVTVTPTLAYGSAINSYKVIVDGSTYASASFTTNVAKSSGTITASATVTDKRGYSGSGSTSISVLDYNAPVISKLTVHRCNADGSTNDKGEAVKIEYAYTYTSLNGNNSATSYIEYKKSSVSTYESVNNGSATSGQFIIQNADTGSSYDVRLVVTDKITTSSQTTSASTAFTLQHWKDDGTGMGIGKISELSNVLDIGLQTRHLGGILQPVLETGADFNALMIPNTYTLKSCNDAAYVNCPLTYGTGTLKIEACGEVGQIRQTVSICSKTDPAVYERYYYQEAWGEWKNTLRYTLDSGLLIGGTTMPASKTLTLARSISSQPSGVVLVFSEYGKGSVGNMNVALDKSFHSHFIPKSQISDTSKGFCFHLATSDLQYYGIMHLYISNTTIVGDDNNTATVTSNCGITYTNGRFALRAVIGV